MRLIEAIEALGAVPVGYCFCGSYGDPTKIHKPECRDLQIAIEDINTQADSEWCESKGFHLTVDNDGHYAVKKVGPFEIVLSGDIYMDRTCKTGLSITAKHPQNPHDLRYSVHHTIADNPTREQILNLLHGLGDEDV